jgi:hypothetical protein
VTDAEVQVINGKEKVTFDGQSASASINTSNGELRFKLKQVGGRWLIYQETARATDFSIPTAPGGASPVPSGST